MLRNDYGLGSGNGTNSTVLQIVELEELGWEGKELQASIALATGRTSTPACFVRTYSIGGYTDGFKANNDHNSSTQFIPDPSRDLRLKGASGLTKMNETGELGDLIMQIGSPN